MARCCQGSTCSCVITEGTNISITGDGSTQNPFVISSAGGAVETQDNSVFNLIMTGDGSTGNPYTLSVEFAATAKLDDLPDVNAAAPTNGQVLSWNAGTSRWVPAAPTTAAAGAVTTDTSLDGDGSVGDPLVVLEAPTRFLTTTASGLGVSDAGINNMVRHYADAAARTADPIAFIDNALTVLDTNPGQIEYWDGAAWEPIPSGDQLDVVGGSEFWVLSGSYVAGMPLTHIIKQVAETTDGSGDFTILSATDLALAAGVLSVQYQETGSQAYRAVLSGSGSEIKGRAYRLTNGTAWAAQSVAGIVDAWLY